MKYESKKDGKDQEPIQLSTTPFPLNPFLSAHSGNNISEVEIYNFIAILTSDPLKYKMNYSILLASICMD